MNDAALIDLLRRLVAIPSVNPHLSDDPAVGGEERLARYFREHLDSAGFRTEWHEVIRGRPNVVARAGAAKPRRTLLLESHLDTQGIHGMTVDPFGGELRDGRLYGRGACDTKGPMAAMLHVLQPPLLGRLASAGVGLIVVGAVGEEKGNVGAEQLVDLGLGADEAVILEPTDLNVVHAHKGTFWFELEVGGLAAHGSDPSMGRNAIVGMCDAIRAVRSQADEAAATLTHPTLGRPTVNIGVIRGGSSINIVPDRCVVEVDRRIVPGETHDGIRSALGAKLDPLKAAGVISEWTIRPIKEGVPFATTPDSPLVRRLLSSCKAEGASSKAEGAAWFSDAGPFSRTCREIAVFGPGSIRQAHTADEFIEIAELARGARVFERFLLSLADEVEAGGRG